MKSVQMNLFGDEVPKERKSKGQGRRGEVPKQKAGAYFGTK